MLNLLKNKKNSKQDFINDFMDDQNHSWIHNNKSIKKAFEILLNGLKKEQIEFFQKHKTYFIPCEAKLSCAIGSTKNNHLVLIFPELKKILQSPSIYHGIAILAHELGHIYHQHTEYKIETLTAQLEADEFAFKLGYGEELQEVLLENNFSTDCKIRISRLTTMLIEQKFNQ